MSNKKRVSILRKIDKKVLKSQNVDEARIQVIRCISTASINVEDRQIMLDEVIEYDTLEDIQQYVKDAIRAYER